MTYIFNASQNIQLLTYFIKSIRKLHNATNVNQVCLGFLASALFEYAILLFWLRQNRHDEARKQDKEEKRAKWGKPSAMRRQIRTEDQETDPYEAKEQRKLKRKKMMRLADEISTILFPVAFVLFIIIYVATTL